MRKAWVNCPKCSFNLLSLYVEQETNQPAEPSWDDVMNIKTLKIRNFKLYKV